jgi:hypothetical protein
MLAARSPRGIAPGWSATLPLPGSLERMTRNAKKLGVELEERRTSSAVRLNVTDLAPVRSND